MTRPQGRRAWVAAPAEIELATASAVRRQVTEAAGREVEAVVLDLTGTVFCDVLGASALPGARADLAASGVELQLLDPPAVMCRLLDLLGQDHVVVGPQGRSA